jgi:CO/xanthine dehydrogenase Mo-binding subunit
VTERTADRRAPSHPQKPVEAVLVEDPEPDAPYGAKGVGEPPTVVSTAAIVSALRVATGRDLSRVPVRFDGIIGLRP